MKRAAIALACLWAFGVRAQAVPWDATYNPATRVTKIASSSTVPVGSYPNAANSAWGFSKAANGDIYGKATGLVPGPLGAATTTAGAMVSRSVAAKALGVVARGLPVVGMALALADLYGSLGGHVSSSGDSYVYDSVASGKMVARSSTGTGTRWASFGAAGAAVYAEAIQGGCTGNVQGGCQNAGWKLIPNGTAPCSSGAMCVMVGAQDSEQVYQDGVGWSWRFKSEVRWGNAGSLWLVDAPTTTENAMDIGVAAATQPNVDIAPAMTAVAKDHPLDLPMPALKPEESAMPAPQATPWAASQANPAVQERAVYTPRWSEKDQGIVWDKTNESKNAQGQVTATPEAAPSTGAGGDSIDICVEHPEILACQELGEGEDNDDINRKDKNVQAITPWGSFGPSAGSCPAYTASFLGQPIAIDFKLFCDGLSWMRPAVIGLAWIMAGYIFMGALKSGD